jgi:hypothetical protein
MDEGELRAYILTAVASHASKELRRRARKPLHPLEVEREQSTADGHEPLPDEVVIGSEARSVARDLLTSLPERRRAVMLLRYGWGLSPREVCALVPGLSPRAYRKEITRGVEELIEGLGRVESGEWCEERRTLVRDLVAGTADDAGRRQALEHLRHCRACADFAAGLRHDLYEAGSALGLASVAGSIGGATLLQRLTDLIAGAVERADSAVTALTAGGVKGSGAGILANVAGVGGAAKATVACIGAGAAATACVAAGVVPGVSLGGDSHDAGSPPAKRVSAHRHHVAEPRSAIASVRRVSRAVEPEEPAVTPHDESGPAPVESPPSDPAPDPAGPVTPPPVQEFDPVAATAPSPAPASGAPPAPSGGSPDAGSVAQEEFGP